MKIWRGYGTEHSANLVMIGSFKDVASAEIAKDIIEKLTATLESEETSGRLVVGEPTDRYGENVLQVLSELDVHNVRPTELEQFLYPLELKREGDSIVITTEETDIQALIKVMMDRGARIEIYSRHDYPDEGLGDGRQA